MISHIILLEILLHLFTFQPTFCLKCNFIEIVNLHISLFLHNNFPDDFEKMNRKIDRFKNLLETCNEKITFVRKSHGSHHHKEYNNVINDIDDAINLDLLLLKKYPNLT